MTSKAYRRFRNLRNKVREDEEIRYLEKEICRLRPRIAELRATLPQEQWDLISEYIGLHGEENIRLIELLCFSDSVAAEEA